MIERVRAWCGVVLVGTALGGCSAGSPSVRQTAAGPAASVELPKGPAEKQPETPAPPPPGFPEPTPDIVTPSSGSPSADELLAARLEPGSCKNSQQAVERLARPTIRRMRADVDQAYRDYQSNLPYCWQRYRENEVRWKSKDGALSGIGFGGGGYGTGIGLSSVGTLGHGRTRASHVAKAQRFSRTNNQVNDVDEADLVKTDGKYVYFSLNGALRIVSALNPRVLSVTRITGKVRDLFVEGDRAVVFSSVGGNGRPACKYGYDCEFMGDGSSTRITVLDVTDRGAPKVVRNLGSSGSIVASRRIGNAVHTVVSQGDAGDPIYDTWLHDLPECGVKDSAVRARMRALKERNEHKIRAYFADAGPTLRDGKTVRSLCDNVYQTRLGAGEAFTTLVSFDLTKDDVAPAATTLRSRPGAVFAAADALYVSITQNQSSPRGGRWDRTKEAGNEISEVHKFRIGGDPSATRYVGSGIVPGHVLNQFSMDQWFGYLRIATSRGRVPDPKVESAVSVLAEAPNGSLVRVGAVEHIAPGEDIRAVRFDAERGYLVTFKKTDPLFALDLLDPANPRVLGELKIPGFSTYLQRIDRDHLISIGFDADDRGSFAYFDGLLLQLFDVSAPTDPKLLFKEKLGTRGSGSEAATDHLAFNYFGERGWLGVPATVCEGGGNGQSGTLAFSGLLLYDVDVKTGFKRRGGIDHGERGADCSQWWSRSKSAVKRSIFLDDLVYSIADDRVKVQLMSQLGKDVADLDMTTR